MFKLGILYDNITKRGTIILKYTKLFNVRLYCSVRDKVVKCSYFFIVVTLPLALHCFVLR